jgi:hypothetical protein
MLLLVRLIHFINVRLSTSFFFFFFFFFLEIFKFLKYKQIDWLNKEFQTSKVMKSKKQKQTYL